MYHGRGTLGKSRNRVNVLWNVCLPVNSRGKQALLNVQIMISDRFSYRYRIIEFYGALNCLDYYLSLNLGQSNCHPFGLEKLYRSYLKHRLFWI